MRPKSLQRIRVLSEVFNGVKVLFNIGKATTVLFQPRRGVGAPVAMAKRPRMVDVNRSILRGYQNLALSRWLR